MWNPCKCHKPITINTLDTIYKDIIIALRVFFQSYIKVMLSKI